MTAPVCILGGTGYIGRLLSHELKNSGFTPITVARSSHATIRQDLAHTHGLQQLLNEREFAAIVNLAGAGVTAADRDSHLMQDVNAHLPARLVEIVTSNSLRTPILHVASSTEPLPGAVPESEYSACKGRGTQYFSTALTRHDVLGAIAVVHNVYGPHQPASRFVRAAIESAKAGKMLHLHFPDRIRDFTYEADVAYWLRRWVQSPVEAPERFEIGTSHGTPLHDVLVEINALLGLQPADVDTVVEHLVDPNPSVIANINPGDFGYCPTSLRDGLRFTVSGLENL